MIHPPKESLMFKKILVPFDVSPSSENAFSWAVEFGKHFSSQLNVLHVIPHLDDLVTDQKIKMKDDIESTIVNDIKDRIEQLNTSNNTGKSSVTISIKSGNATKEILSEINHQQPDLVILGTNGRTGLDHILLGSVAEKIIQHSSAPLLIAKTAPKWPLKKILLPYDFTENCDQSLLSAVLLCEELNAELELIHVVTPPEVYALYQETAAVYDDDYLQKIKIRAQQKIEQTLKKSSAIKINIHILVGALIQEICNKAIELNCDMIVVPTHGRKNFAHFLMGSVAEQVARYAKTPVLTFMNAAHKEEKKSFLSQLFKK